MNTRIVFAVLIGIVAVVLSKPVITDPKTAISSSLEPLSDQAFYELLKRTLDSLNKKVLRFKDVMDEKKSGSGSAKKELNTLEYSLEKAIAEDSLHQADVSRMPNAAVVPKIKMRKIKMRKIKMPKIKVPKIKIKVPKMKVPNKIKVSSLQEKEAMAIESDIRSVKMAIKKVTSSFTELRRSYSGDGMMDEKTKSKFDAIATDLKKVIDGLKQLQNRFKSMAKTDKLPNAPDKIPNVAVSPSEVKSAVDKMLSQLLDVEKAIKILKGMLEENKNKKTLTLTTGVKNDVKDVTSSIKDVTSSFADLKGLYSSVAAAGQQPLDEKATLSLSTVKENLKDVMTELKLLKDQFSAVEGGVAMDTAVETPAVKFVMGTMKRQLKDAANVIKVLKDTAKTMKKYGDVTTKKDSGLGNDDRSAEEKLMALREEFNDVRRDVKVTEENMLNESSSEKRGLGGREALSKRSLLDLKKELDEIRDEVEKIKSVNPKA